MSAATFFGVRIPVCGGGYFRILPYWLTRMGLKQINEKCNRPFTFYLHPWEIDPDPPRVRLPLAKSFAHYFQLGGFRERLEQVIRGAGFAPMGEVLGLASLSR